MDESTSSRNRYGLALGQACVRRRRMEDDVESEELRESGTEGSKVCVNDVAGAVSQGLATAMQPVMEQMREGNSMLRRMEEATYHFIQEFEEVIAEERRRAESRLHLHESFLRQHADRVAEASARLSGSPVAHGGTVLAGEAPPRPAGSASQELAPVEASLQRLEMALSRQQKQLDDMPSVQERTGVALNHYLSSADADSKRFRGCLLPGKTTKIQPSFVAKRSNAASKQPSTGVTAKQSSVKAVESNAKAMESVGSKSSKAVESVSSKNSKAVESIASKVDSSLLDSEASATKTKAEVSDGSVGTVDLFTTETEGKRLNMPGLPMSEAESVVYPLEETGEGKRRNSIMGVPMQDISQLRGDEDAPQMQRALYDYGMATLEWLHKLKEPNRRGPLAAVVRSRTFGAFCMAVIAVNAGFMVYTVNAKMSALGKDDYTAMIAEVGESIFLSWYLIELLMKMFVHRSYFFVGTDWTWNIFDLLLVTVAIYFQFFGFLLNDGKTKANTTVLRSLRVLKLTKVLRAVRIMRYLKFFSTVKLILHAAVGSWVSLFWSSVMLCFVYYLFAIIFVMGLTDWLALHPDRAEQLWGEIYDSFGSVQGAMLTLFKATFSGNPWDIYYQIVSQTNSYINISLFCFFIAFVKISLYNIITAIFVEFTIRLGAPDTSENARHSQIKERNDARELRRILSQLDEDGSGVIEIDQLEALLQQPYTRHHLDVLGLDLRNMEEFFEMLGLESCEGRVNIETFVQGCIKLRGLATIVGQRSLLLEAKLMRRAQRDLCLVLSQRMESLIDKVTTSLDRLDQPRSRKPGNVEQRVNFNAVTAAQSSTKEGR